MHKPSGETHGTGHPPCHLKHNEQAEQFVRVGERKRAGVT